jgi:hypothetical protein
MRNVLLTTLLLLPLSACEVMTKREVPEDPKTPATESSGGSSSSTTTRTPLSRLLSTVEVESTSIRKGQVIGVTLTTRDVRGDLYVSTGMTIQMGLAGGGSIGIVGSLVDHADGTYTTTLQGYQSGSASSLVTAIEGSPIKSSPSITVNAATATKVLIESAPLGGGSTLTSATVTDGAPLALYAAGRDDDNNYIGPVTVAWTQTSSVGLLSSVSGAATVLRANQADGTAQISVTHATLGAATLAATARWTATSVTNATTGLVLWTKADSLTGAVANGGTVASWTDLSGHAHHAVQATASKKPTFKSSGLNSLPTLSFDGTDDSLTVAHTAAFLATRLSVFAVAKTNVSRDYQAIVAKTSNAFDEGFLFGSVDAASSGKLGLFVNAVGNAAKLTVATGAFKVVSGTYDGSNVKVRVSPSTVANSTAYAGNLNTSVNDLIIGDYNGNASCVAGCWQGEMAEILLYDQALSDTDRLSVEAYLRAKYGL